MHPATLLIQIKSHITSTYAFDGLSKGAKWYRRFMDTVVCGASAYQFWRTPPIVLHLAAGSSDNPALRKAVGEDELIAFRQSLIEGLPLTRACADGPAWRHAGALQKAIREYQLVLAPSMDLPVDVLVDCARERRSSSFVKTALCKGALPRGAVRGVDEDLSVTSPAFTMLQLARSASLQRTVLLASELCGCYAVYRAPAPVAYQLQKMIRRHRLPEIDGWRPCLTAEGQLTDLWSRPPLVEPHELIDMAVQSDSLDGKKRLIRAAELVKPMAASPFETQAGVLLGFPKLLGGAGLGGFTHNEKVDLTPDARLLARRDCCYCDLFWPDGLDVECQSALYHNNVDGYLSDSDRTAALSLVGVDVLPLTYDQMRDPKRFAAFVHAAERSLGRKRAEPSEAQKRAAQKLREEAFVDWWSLPRL